MKRYIYVVAVQPVPGKLDYLNELASRLRCFFLPGIKSTLLQAIDIARPSFAHCEVYATDDRDAYDAGWETKLVDRTLRRCENKYGRRYYLLNDYVVEVPDERYVRRLSTS